MPFIEVNLSTTDKALLGTENRHEIEQALAIIAEEAITEFAGTMLDVSDEDIERMALGLKHGGA